MRNNVSQVRRECLHCEGPPKSQPPLASCFLLNKTGQGHRQLGSHFGNQIRHTARPSLPCRSRTHPTPPPPFGAPDSCESWVNGICLAFTKTHQSSACERCRESRAEQTVDGHIWHVLRASKDGRRTGTIPCGFPTRRQARTRAPHSHTHHFTSFPFTSPRPG